MSIFRLGARGNNDIPVQDRVLTVANAITLVRLLLVPLLSWLVAVQHAWLIAFIIFWAAAVMDALDGFVARRFNQVTKIGTWLDPTVDRLVMIAILLILALAHVIQVWLLACVAARELALGLIVLIICHGRMPVSVANTGKLGTLLLFFGLPGLLLGRVPVPDGSYLRAFVIVLVSAGLALYYLSLVQYTKMALRWRSNKNVAAKAAT